MTSAILAFLVMFNPFALFLYLRPVMKDLSDHDFVRVITKATVISFIIFVQGSPATLQLLLSTIEIPNKQLFQKGIALLAKCMLKKRVFVKAQKNDIKYDFAYVSPVGIED